MNSKPGVILFLFFVLLVVISCSPSLYLPTMADSQKMGVSIDTLTLGRNLYVKNCGSCHNLYKAEQFTKSGWYKVMPVMQKKAKINNQDRKLMLNYLLARSKDSQNPVTSNKKPGN